MNPNLIIKEITDTSIQIGKKVIYKDTHDNWVALSALSDEQRAAVEAHLLEKGEKFTA